jgi:acylphosphatase
MNAMRATVRVQGRVQGVGFRYFVRCTARALHLTGWVRNLNNGDVEAVLEGPAADVEQAIEALRQGPPQGRVERLLVERTPCRNEFFNFEIRL